MPHGHNKKFYTGYKTDFTYRSGHISSKHAFFAEGGIRFQVSSIEQGNNERHAFIETLIFLLQKNAVDLPIIEEYLRRHGFDGLGIPRNTNISLMQNQDVAYLLNTALPRVQTDQYNSQSVTENYKHKMIALSEELISTGVNTIIRRKGQ